MSFPLENNTNAKTQCNTKIIYMRKIKYVSGKGMNEEISNNIGKRERWPDVLSQKQQCCSQSAWIEFCIWLSQVWTRNGIAVYRWLPLTHSSPNPSKRNHFSLPPKCYVLSASGKVSTETILPFIWALTKLELNSLLDCALFLPIILHTFQSFLHVHSSASKKEKLCWRVIGSGYHNLFTWQWKALQVLWYLFEWSLSTSRIKWINIRHQWRLSAAAVRTLSLHIANMQFDK